MGVAKVQHTSKARFTHPVQRSYARPHNGRTSGRSEARAIEVTKVEPRNGGYMIHFKEQETANKRKAKYSKDLNLWYILINDCKHYLSELEGSQSDLFTDVGTHTTMRVNKVKTNEQTGQIQLLF